MLLLDAVSFPPTEGSLCPRGFQRISINRSIIKGTGMFTFCLCENELFYLLKNQSFL